MFVRPANPVSHRLARMALILACVAALIVASAGPLHRYLGLDVEAVIAIFRYGFYIAIAAAALGLATVVPAARAIVIGVVTAYTPVDWFLRAQRLPELNDVSTDIANPPALVVTAQLRRGAPNPPAYPGASAGVLQRAAYPDIVPVVLPIPPAEAFRRVDAVATAMDWDVVARAPAD